MSVQVDFCREIHPGDRGGDVVVHKIGLSRWNPHVYPWPKGGEFTDFAGRFFWPAVYEFKRTHGLLSAVEKRERRALVLGFRTHEALERARRAGHPGEWAFDAHSVALAHEFCRQWGKTPQELAREKGLSALLFWYAHRASTAYSQVRPMDYVTATTWLRRGDCSTLSSNAHHVAGFPDPNGLGYDREGYTGTQKIHGVRVSSVAELSILDLIFYGSSSGRPGFAPGDPTHVAVFAGEIAGAPSVVSLGHYPMGLYRYNYRGINQMRHYTYSRSRAKAFLAGLATEEER